MSTVAYKNYEQKQVTSAQAVAYQSFGWIRSNERPDPALIKGKRKAVRNVVIKRKNDFGENAKINDLEKRYQKLEKKRYKNKPLLGIITFILMLALLVVGGLELYLGITKALDAKAEYDAKLEENAGEEGDEELNEEENLVSAAAKEEADDENKEEEKAEGEEGTEGEEGAEGEEAAGGIGAIIENIDKNYLSLITNFLEGTTDEETGEYTPGIIDNVTANLPEALAIYINANMVVGVVAVILGIVFLIIFAEVAKMKKKRAKKFAKMEAIQEEAEQIVDGMRRRDLSLMGKTQRQQYVWRNIIASAIKDAMPAQDDDDDYDF